MTRIITFIAILLGLLAASACARPAATGETSGAGDSSDVSSTVPASSPDSPAGTPQPTQPDSRAVDLAPVHWNQAEPADSTVTVRYQATGQPGCQVLGRVDVVETETAVTITVLLGHWPDADCAGPVPQVAADYATTVTLLAPIGTRGITDGAPE